MHIAMKELLPEIQQGRCILFLGSGSSVACESPSGGGLTGDGLAEALVKHLGEDPTQFKTALMEAGEYVEAYLPQHRNALDTLIYDRLHDLRPTIGHLLLTVFPWRAIVTTNYNRVVETGYEVAGTRQLTTSICVPFRTDDDLDKNTLAPGNIALYKPHGCLTIRGNRDAPMVLTARDYYHSMKKRKKMYEHIKQLAGKFSTLFMGYSLVDYNFNNIYYELQETLGEYLARSYSVIPVPANKAPYLDRVYERRDIALFDDKFDTFMLSLVDHAGLLSSKVVETVVEELSRTDVVQRLGNYARNLPPVIQTEIGKKGIVIP